MYKLILHHPYQSPIPHADRSGNNNHGNSLSVKYAPNGATLGAGAAIFNGDDSRLIVPAGPIWDHMTGVMVEASFRIDELGHRHNIVEGSMSFALFIRASGELMGSFFGVKKDDNSDNGLLGGNNSLAVSLFNGGGSVEPGGDSSEDVNQPPLEGELDWITVGSADDTAVGPPKLVPVGEWVKVTFIHNGTSLLLYMNGELVGARHDVISPVLSVQSGGVHIGAWPPLNSNPYSLKGAIDDLRIWKYDPHYRYRKFFCRPMSEEISACWHVLHGELNKLAADPDTRDSFLKILDKIKEAETELIRTVTNQGKDAIQTGVQLGRQYDELWCSGKIGSPDAQTFTQEWMHWIEENAGEAFYEYLQEIMQCLRQLKRLTCEKEITLETDCDDDFHQFGRLLKTAFYRCPKSRDPKC